MRLRNVLGAPWLFSFVFAAIVLVAIVAVSGQGGGGTLSLAVSLAPYLVLVALGQMLVITTGPGNIDVSVASVLSLAGFTSIWVTNATSSVLLGLLTAVATGAAVAAISVVSIAFLAIPPIVATLASGLIASSFTLALANGFTGNPDPTLRAFLNLRLLGVPVLAVVVLVLTIGVGAGLRYTVFGRSLLAVGQNRRAAAYAGVATRRTVAVTYLASGVLAGLTGALLATYIAPTPDLGTTYLLDSIAVTIIGGTLISGGRAVPTGVWGGALFFILLDGLLNLVGWSAAGQNVLKGLLLLAVLFLAGGSGIRIRRPSAPTAGAPPAAPEPAPAGGGTPPA
jgi:ribose transport system permease protein